MIDIFEGLADLPSSFQPPPIKIDELKRRTFIPGRTYVFASKSLKGGGIPTGMNASRMRRLVFLGDQKGAGGIVHHLFSLKDIGWKESFTDAQCLEYSITEEAAS